MACASTDVVDHDSLLELLGKAYHYEGHSDLWRRRYGGGHADDGRGKASRI